MTAMKTLRRLVALGLFLAAATAGASALSIKHLFKVPPLTYSPDSVVQGSSTVRVSNEGYIGPFAVVMTQLSLSPVRAAPAEQLRYGMYQPSASPSYKLAIDGSPSGSTELLLGSFPAGSAKNAFIDLGFAALVSPLSLPPPGTYTASLRADLYASSYPVSGAPVDSFIFNVVVTVGSNFDVSVQPAGSAFSVQATSGSMAFGTLHGGDMRSLDILVRSNVGYSLAITSANGGALGNRQDGSLLGYDATVGGTALVLEPGVPASLAAGAPATFSAARRYTLAVTIRPFVDMPTEGDYSDTLTLTLTAP